MSKGSKHLNLTLSEVDPTYHLQLCSAILLLGIRGSGKTTTLKYLLTCLFKRGIRRFAAFTGNGDAAVDLESVLHPLYINKAEIRTYEEIIKYQESKIGPLRKKHDRQEALKERADRVYQRQEFQVPLAMQVVILLDDLAENAEFMNSPLARDVASNGRHFGVTQITAVQNIVQSATRVRDQTNHVFVTFVQNERQINQLHSSFFGGSHLMDRNQFALTLTAITAAKGHVVLIDCDKESSRNVQSKIHIVRVPKCMPRMQVGSKRYIQYAKEHYLSNDPLDHEVDEDPVDDTTSVVSLHRRPDIDVQHLLRQKHMATAANGSTVHVQMVPFVT